MTSTHGETTLTQNILRYINPSKRISPDSGNETDIAAYSSSKKIKRPIFIIKEEEMQAFFNLLGESVSGAAILSTNPQIGPNIGGRMNVAQESVGHHICIA